MSTILESVLNEKEPKTGTMITLRMPDELLQRLNAVCNDKRVHKPRARIIKAMIEAGLEEMENALKQIDKVEASNQNVNLLMREMERSTTESNGWVRTM